MNFRELEKEAEAAADLLRLSAFLSPDSIPLEFLATGAPELGNLLAAALADAQEDPLALDETLAPLTNFSLIRRRIRPAVTAFIGSSRRLYARKWTPKHSACGQNAQCGL